MVRRPRPCLCFCFLAAILLPAVSGAEASGAPETTPRSRPLACGIWVGRIGHFPVAVTLHPGTDPANVEGSYGYLRRAKPIALAGSRTAKGFALEEHAGKGASLSGRWEVTWRKASSGRALAGMWRSANGKRRLPIDLSCVAGADGAIVDERYASALGQAPVATQFERLLRAGTIAGKPKRAGIATVSEATSVSDGRVYPQVTGLPNREAMDEINRWLAKTSKESTTRRSDDPDDGTCNESVTLTILHASPNFVTVYVVSEDDCGVHPEEDEQLVTFDITGAHAVQLDFATILPLDDTPTKRRSFLRALSRLGDQRDGDSDDGCSGDDDYRTFSFGVVKDGILVEVDHGAHVTEPCDFQVTFPHRIAKRFLSSKAPQPLREGRY